MAYYCKSCTIYRWGLEGWLSGRERWLRFQRTQVWVPAHMVAHNPLSPQFQGIRCFLLTYAGTTCKGCIHADKTPVNISKLLCVAAALVTMGTIAPHSTVCFPGVVTSRHFIKKDTHQESCDLAWGVETNAETEVLKFGLGWWLSQWRCLQLGLITWVPNLGCFSSRIVHLWIVQYHKIQGEKQCPKVVLWPLLMNCDNSLQNR